MKNKLLAEFFGTAWLVFGGCGSAILAAKFFSLEGTTPFNLGIGLVGVSLAFGLTVLTMAYAIGHISGCHLNPAVSVGLCVGGRFKASELLPYIIAQVLGGAAGAGVLYVIASGQAGFSTAGGFASNGFGDHSPGHYSMVASLVSESVLTGLLGQIAFRQEKNTYQASGDRLVTLFPGSNLYERREKPRQGGAAAKPGDKSRQPQWIVAGEIVVVAFQEALFARIIVENTRHRRA